MGMNYYAVKKNNLLIEDQIYTILNDISFFDLKKDIEELIILKHKDAIKLLNEDQKEKYYDILKSTTSKFITKIKYDVNDIFNITESEKIHIGKSSMGWLFNFQEQNAEECTWHNYEEVFDWLEKNTIGENALYDIVDEINRKQTLEEFKDLVDTKQQDKHNLENPENFKYCKNVNGYRFSSNDFS